MMLKTLVEQALDLDEPNISIRSIVVEGPILRIWSPNGKQATVYTDNVMIRGTCDSSTFFIDADMMNFQCSFRVDPDFIKDMGTHISVLREHVTLNGVTLSGHSASGTINWNAVSIEPKSVGDVLRRHRGLLRDQVLEYFRGNKDQLIGQLNKILPSIVTLIR